MAALRVSTAVDMLVGRPVERAACAEQHVSLDDGPLPPATMVLALVAAEDEVQHGGHRRREAPSTRLGRGTPAAVRIPGGLLHFLEL